MRCHFVFLVVVGVVSGQGGNHEKFWSQPDFFASLSDYLMTAPVTHHPPESGHQFNHGSNDYMGSASELVHSYAPAPTPTQQVKEQASGAIIPAQELSAVMNFALGGGSSPASPSQDYDHNHNFVDKDIEMDSYLNYARHEYTTRPPPPPIVVRNEIPQKMTPPYTYGEEYSQYYGGVEALPPLEKPKPRPHPNALSDPKKKTSTRRRPQLQPEDVIKALELSTTMTSVSSSTSPSTPRSTTSVTTSTPKSTSTSRSTPRPAVTSTPAPVTTSRNDGTNGKVRYLSPQQIAQLQRTRFQHVVTVPESKAAVSHLQKTVPQANRFNVVTLPQPIRAPPQPIRTPQPQFRIVTVPQIRQVSPNVEVMVAREVYQGMGGVPSFKLPAAAAHTQIISNQHIYNQFAPARVQSVPQPLRASHSQNVRLNPNILIAAPASYVQHQEKRVGGDDTIMAQGSNPFGVVVQDENYLQKETPGFVNKISNILETGRRILYFPKGVVDVVDHAMTYAEANPYVNYVMGSLADTLLGSTKGSSAAPVVGNGQNKVPLPTLLIADPGQKMGPK